MSTRQTNTGNSNASINTTTVWDRIISLEEGFSGIPIKIDSIVPTYTAGLLTKVEEKEGLNVRISSEITYNDNGSINTVTESSNGKTVITTLNYVNGEFSNITREVI